MITQINLIIDGKNVVVPPGTLIVDAAKKIGIDIPVFCYHPKMEPVGMCRMCLVEVGRPVIDRSSGEFIIEDDGSIKVEFSAKLETACTTPVSEGMVVVTASEKVKIARDDILEFLLTSHPLDCPICDKGGECPLQNLTMNFGPGQSRFKFDEKMHLAKHVPLGELIFLDRERCIQCGRCVRFQESIADDPVIAFYQRGRSLQIISCTEPGFDSIWSGNTTDICPVGALTTTDFRFGARPWELNSSASICTHCPVGCNLTINTRREAKTSGKNVIKRVMPRQNEWVNEIWICDKGRFGYHFAESKERITQPLIRKDGELLPAEWDEAISLVANHFQSAGEKLVSIAGGRLSNEDLYNLQLLTTQLGGKNILYSTMAGGDLVAQVGVGSGTNFLNLGEESAILVVATDLEQEAPLWWLRIKQATERGAHLIVVNARPTKLDRYASHILRYTYGNETSAILALINHLSAKRPNLSEAGKQMSHNKQYQEAAKTFAKADNAIVLFGSDGTGLLESKSLAQACANLLIITNHIGRPNNGLIGVWQRANEQGAWDIGFRPSSDLKQTMKNAGALYIVAADPAGDDPNLIETGDFLVVQDLFLSATAKLADVFLPALAFTEREATFTSGERRIQRFFLATPPLTGCLPDFSITAKIAKQCNIFMEEFSPSRVMDEIAKNLRNYAEISYQKISQVIEQWPIVGRKDLYYGGTTYENRQGLGYQLQSAAERGEAIELSWPTFSESVVAQEGLLAVPITCLYDRGTTILPSSLLHQRLSQPCLYLNPDEAKKLGVIHNDLIQIILNSTTTLATAYLEDNIPEGVILVPRSTGIPILTPQSVKIQIAPKVTG